MHMHAERSPPPRRFQSRSHHRAQCVFSAACEPEGNLLLMNVIKTNESHFLLWYKQFVISHEDSIIVDFHLVMLIIEKKKKRLRVKLSLAFCLGLCAPSNGTARFI